MPLRTTLSASPHPASGLQGRTKQCPKEQLVDYAYAAYAFEALGESQQVTVLQRSSHPPKVLLQVSTNLGLKAPGKSKAWRNLQSPCEQYSPYFWQTQETWILGEAFEGTVLNVALITFISFHFVVQPTFFQNQDVPVQPRSQRHACLKEAFTIGTNPKKSDEPLAARGGSNEALFGQGAPPRPPTQRGMPAKFGTEPWGPWPGRGESCRGLSYQRVLGESLGLNLVCTTGRWGVYCVPGFGF